MRSRLRIFLEFSRLKEKQRTEKKFNLEKSCTTALCKIFFLCVSQQLGSCLSYKKSC